LLAFGLAALRKSRARIGQACLGKGPIVRRARPCFTVRYRRCRALGHHCAVKVRALNNLQRQQAHSQEREQHDPGPHLPPKSL
jgi:hypothetical protein